MMCVSMATSEQSFSKYKQIKINLQSTITMLSIERELAQLIDFEDITHENCLKVDEMGNTFLFTSCLLCLSSSI